MRFETCELDDGRTYDFQVCDNCLEDIGYPIFTYTFDTFKEHYCLNCKMSCDYEPDSN